MNSLVVGNELEVEKRLDTYFDNDVVDPLWSAATEDDAKEAFVGVVGSWIKTADCRTNVCRFVILSDARESQNAIARQIAGVGPFASSVFYVYKQHPVPPITTVLYVSRPGVPLMSLLAVP